VDYYARLKETESYSTWTHFTNRGHVGKVLCVASSDATDYIVSGGEDYTMRIWGYDTQADPSGGPSRLSYDLIAVLLHDVERHFESDICAEASVEDTKRWSIKTLLGRSTKEEEDTDVKRRGVTAVACVGTRGPFVSGTARGDLFVLFLGFGDSEGCCIPQEQLHADRITEIAAPSGAGDVDEDSAWTLAVASADGTAKVLRFRGTDDVEVVTLGHDGLPVLGVRHVEGGGQDAASFVTYTERAVYIWNTEGICRLMLDDFGQSMSNLPAGGSTLVTDMAIANQESGSLLFVGTEETISVWGFQEGQLCGPHGECPPPEPYDRSPLVIYKDHTKSLGVDQSRQSTDFLVELRDDYSCAVWNLKGVKAGDLAIQPHGPAALLASEKRKTMLLDLQHSARVQQIHVARDPNNAGGPCLISACGDGSLRLWDLEGVDRGEIYGELRSLRIAEICLPVILLLVPFFQVTSFAFGPSIKWRDEVRRPAHFTQKIVWGEFDYVLRLRRDLVFIPMIEITLGLICFFLVMAVAGIPDLLRHGIHLTQSTTAYKRERKSGAKGLLRASGKMTLLKRLLQGMLSAVGFIMLLCSTILVAPVFKICAQALHCVPEPGGPASELHLAVAPQVRCHEGLHLRLTWAVLVLVPAYFLVLVPYAAVEGDIKYMKWGKLFIPQAYWAEAARRKATVVNLGPLHPNPGVIFRTLSLDLTAKALLPVIETETTRTPMLQMLLITAVGVGMYASSLCFPPRMDRMFVGLVQDTRLFTLCAMLCGCLTVVLEEGSVVPVVALGVFAILVPMKTIRMMRSNILTPPAVQRCLTSTVIEAESNNTNMTNNVMVQEPLRSQASFTSQGSPFLDVGPTASYPMGNRLSNRPGDSRRRAKGVKGVMKKMAITLF